MKHFSTMLCVFALGATITLGASCTKQTVSPATSDVVKDFKSAQHDSTSNDSTEDHHCGQGDHHGQR